MKLIFILGLITFGITSMCGCRHTDNACALNDVETIIRDNPDSAIKLLETVDTALLKSPREKAHYHLLMADALFKVGHKDTLSDHVIPAMEYYKIHGSRQEAARAYFYSGLAKYNQKRYSSATVDLLHSESISKIENDTLQLAFIYRAIGDNFFHTNDLESSMSYYQKSYDFFKSQSEDNYADSVYTDIERVKEIDELLTETDLKPTFFKIKSYLADGAFEEVLESFYSNLDELNKNLAISCSSNLGAEVISYKQQESELIKASNKRERIFWIFILILLLLSISLVCVLMFKRNKILRLERDSYMMAADNLSKALSFAEMRSNEKENQHNIEVGSLQSAIDDSKNAIRNLLSAQFADLSELCQTYFLYDKHKSAQTKVYNKVKELVARFNYDKQFNENLENTINGSLNNLMSNFRKDFPNLNEWEYPLFMYNVCCMEPRTIALFLEERADLIYKRKANLKRKIANSNATLKEEYLLYLS